MAPRGLCFSAFVSLPSSILLMASVAWAEAPAVPATTRASAQSPAASAAGVFERSVVEVAPSPSVPLTALRVDNPLGDVRIEGHPTDDEKNVVIFAFKRGPTNEVLDRLKVQLVPNGTGGVMVSTSMAAGPELRPIAVGSARIDLLVRAPRGVSVEAVIWDGHVEVVSMEGGGHAMANRGAIDLRDVRGKWSTDGTRASQRFERIHGAVEVTALVGDVDFDRVSGERIIASVHRGHIVARRVQVRDLDLRTTDGDILLEQSGFSGGRYRVSSYRGNVEIRLEGQSRVQLRAVAREGVVSFPEGVAVRVAHDGTRLAELGAEQQALVIEIKAQHGNVQFGVMSAPR